MLAMDLIVIRTPHFAPLKLFGPFQTSTSIHVIKSLYGTRETPPREANK